MATASCSVSVQGYFWNGSSTTSTGYTGFGGMPKSSAYFATVLKITLPSFSGEASSLSVTVQGNNNKAGGLMASGKQYCYAFSTSSSNSTYQSGTSSSYDGTITYSSQIADDATVTLPAITKSGLSSYSSGSVLYLYLWGYNATSVYSYLKYVGATATLTYTPYYYKTIEYNANGGSGAPSSQTSHSTSSTLSMTISSTTPTRTGYTFLGWSTSSSATSSSYTPGSTYNFTGSTSGSTTTLYAVWQVNTYTVTLDNQGATTAGTTSVNVTYGNQMPSITIPQKTGYTFGGYFTQTNGAGTMYYNSNGASASTYTLTSNTTLYAFWVDGTSPVASITSTNNVSDNQIASLIMSDNVGVTSYEFNTTGTFSNYTSITSATNVSISEIITSPGTYYLSCKDSDGNVSTPVNYTWYQINLEANGGSLGNGINHMIIGAGNTIAPSVPTRDGYNFLGWATSADAETGVYEFTVNASATYHAIWEQNGARVYYGYNNQWCPASVFFGNNGSWN